MTAQPPNKLHPPAKPEPAQQDVASPLDQMVQEIVDLVPHDKREQALTRMVKVVSSVEEFSGHMPHPQHAREYEAICPGSFDRMLRMREEELEYGMERDRLEQAHAREWEITDQQNASIHTKMGLTFGFMLGLTEQAPPPRRSSSVTKNRKKNR